MATVFSAFGLLLVIVGMWICILEPGRIRWIFGVLLVVCGCLIQANYPFINYLRLTENAAARDQSQGGEG